MYCIRIAFLLFLKNRRILSMKIDIFDGYKKGKNEKYFDQGIIKLKKNQKFKMILGKKKLNCLMIDQGKFVKCRLFGEKKITKFFKKCFDPKNPGASNLISENIVEIFRTKNCAEYISIFIDGNNYKYEIQNWR